MNEYLLDGSSDEKPKPHLSGKKIVHDLNDENLEGFIKERIKESGGSRDAIALAGADFEESPSRKKMVEDLLVCSESYAEQVRRVDSHDDDQPMAMMFSRPSGGGGIVSPAHVLSDMNKQAMLQQGLPAVIAREKATRFAIAFEAYGYVGDDSQSPEEKEEIDDIIHGRRRLEGSKYAMEVLTIISYDAETDMAGVIMRRIDRSGAKVRLLPIDNAKLNEAEEVKLSSDADGLGFGASSFKRVFEAARLNTL